MERGVLTDNMYSLFRQASERDISTDMRFRKECADIIKQVLAGLNVSTDQILELVEFSLDTDASGAGSNKRPLVRQSASAAPEQAATLHASTENSRTVAAAAAAVFPNAAAAAATEENLGAYVTFTMIEAWRTSLLKRSEEVGNIFKFVLHEKYTQGSWNVNVWIDFVLWVLRTHVETGKPVDCDDCMKTLGLARFQGAEQGGPNILDVMLNHLPAEIFVACSVALGDMSLNGVVVKELYRIAMSASFAESHAFEVEPGALTNSGRLTLRLMEYPCLTQRTRAFRFYSDLFVFNKPGGFYDLCDIYPEVSDNTMKKVYFEVYGDARHRVVMEYGFMLYAFPVVDECTNDFGLKIDEKLISVPTWVNHNTGMNEYACLLAPRFAGYYSKADTALADKEGVTSIQREQVFFSLFSSVDFLNDWRPIFPGKDVDYLSRVLAVFSHRAAPPALFLIAEGVHTGSNPINAFQELLNLAMHWQKLREKIPEHKKRHVEVLLVNRSDEDRIWDNGVEEPAFIKLANVFSDILGDAEFNTVERFQRRYRCSNEQVIHALEVIKSFLTPGAQVFLANIFKLDCWEHEAEESHEGRSDRGLGDGEEEEVEEEAEEQDEEEDEDDEEAEEEEEEEEEEAVDKAEEAEEEQEEDQDEKEEEAAEKAEEAEEDQEEKEEAAEKAEEAEEDQEEEEEEEEEEDKDLPQKRSRARIVLPSQQASTPPPTPVKNLRSSPRAAQATGFAFSYRLSNESAAVFFIIQMFSRCL
jgi:hypothetical protein